MTTLVWNAEGAPASGTVITVGNSGGGSGTPFDAVQQGTAAVLQYDAATAANGTYSLRCATGGTSAMSYVRWTTAVGSMASAAGRFYLRLSALPSATRSILALHAAGLASDRATFALLTTGALRLRNASAATVATFTNPLALGTWYRVEYLIGASAAGMWEMHLYAGNNTAAIEDINGGAATSNFGGPVGAASFGYYTSAPSLPDMWFDGLALGDGGALFGPETPATTWQGAATLAGAADGTATGKLVTPGAAALNGSASLSAAERSVAVAGAGLSGAATLLSTGRTAVTATAGLSGAVLLTAAGTVAVPAAVALNAAGVVTADGTVPPGRIVHRPAIGTVARPSTGIVPRP
ncbi:hypothetical protein Lfu02_79860 [Longispora fulva]|uniref:Uncharacterized protein n=1 Tax=Longispora fulva TaxID=619741 RepID=A0A8J7GMM4_9ACTN|nr:hypothetical protein [Longispora fulva]MBG6141131.1 hypothetical protein [Longispora fulva]GIG63614.1 hypothetical protein Lfu02_79860 [Longispora fulva]